MNKHLDLQKKLYDTIESVVDNKLEKSDLLHPFKARVISVGNGSYTIQVLGVEYELRYSGEPAYKVNDVIPFAAPKHDISSAIFPSVVGGGISGGSTGKGIAIESGKIISFGPVSWFIEENIDSDLEDFYLYVIATKNGDIHVAYNGNDNYYIDKDGKCKNYFMGDEVFFMYSFDFPDMAYIISINYSSAIREKMEDAMKSDDLSSVGHFYRFTDEAGNFKELVVFVEQKDGTIIPISPIPFNYNVKIIHKDGMDTEIEVTPK